MERKVSWVRRPIAWICTILMVMCMNIISGLIIELGEQLTYWLSGLNILVVIFLVMLLGSVYIGLFGWSIWIMPLIIVRASDKIYPSNHAFRYYFVGILEIIGCLIYLYLAVRGFLTRANMFFLYANLAHLFLTEIALIFIGHTEADNRHNSN